MPVASPTSAPARPGPFGAAFLALLAVGLTGACEGPSGTDAAVVSPAETGVELPEAEPFRLATWNLENFPRHPDTIDVVSRLVTDQAFDLVAVQEITDDAAFDELVDRLAGYEGVVGSDPVAYHRLGIIYRASRVDLGQPDVLFGADREAFPRSPLAATVRVLGPGGRVDFDFTLVVVHHKADDDPRSRSRRAAANAALDEWAQARVATSGDPDVVIAGDFNDELGDSESSNVFGPLLDEERYVFLTRELEASGERSFLYFDAFLDHILVTTNALPEYGAGQTTVLPLELSVPFYAYTVSDHRPVVATFVGP